MNFSSSIDSCVGYFLFKLSQILYTRKYLQTNFVECPSFMKIQSSIYSAQCNVALLTVAIAPTFINSDICTEMKRFSREISSPLSGKKAFFDYSMFSSDPISVPSPGV